MSLLMTGPGAPLSPKVQSPEKRISCGARRLACIAMAASVYGASACSASNGADTSIDGSDDGHRGDAGTHDPTGDPTNDAGSTSDARDDDAINSDAGSSGARDASLDSPNRDVNLDAPSLGDVSRPIEGGASDAKDVAVGDVTISNDAPRADGAPRDAAIMDNNAPIDAPRVDAGTGGPVVAFPGAQGFGRMAVGARGGDVYHVTNLNDSGAGSLRDGISQPNRTIVFDVGGVLKIASRLVFKNNQTIAGQTAPGGGITIYGDGTSFSAASNTIVRYVRFRMGIGGESGKDTVTMANGHDVIWDHCSLSWGRDGTFDLNQESGADLYNLTLQDSIVAQGLQTHSTGGLVNTQSTSLIRSLYIDNNSRNPKARGTLQFVNNVIYNWVVSGYILGDTSGRSDGAMIGNYFVTGPETNGGTLDSPTPEYHIFAEDNYYDSNRDGMLNGRLLGQGDFGTATWETTPSASYPPVPAMTAEAAMEHVRAHAGASKFRDDADKYVMAELASFGTQGKTISDETSLGLSGGAGTIPGGTPSTDTDRDGMPDAWETANGLDPNDASDRNQDRNKDGWTNLEEYINSLAP